MKLMDNNGRLFGKISVIDVLVVLLVCVLAVALHVKTNNLSHTSTAAPSQSFSFQVLCEGVPDYVLNNIQPGDPIYDFDNKPVGCLGTVTAVEHEPGTKTVPFSDGTVGRVPYEGTVNLRLTVSAQGLIDRGNYFINRSYALGVNSNRNFYTPFVLVTGIVSAIG